MLIPCDRLLGGTVVFDHEPRLTTHRDVLYVPTGRAKRDAGLFARDGALIEDAGYFRSHPDRISLQSLANPLPRERFDQAPDDTRYVFLGEITGHYGHFITASLARMWGVERFDRHTTRFVLLNHGPLSTPVGIPWVREILGAFGLREPHLVNFAGPTRLHEIVVPAPAFEEGGFAHRILGEVCGHAGRRLATSAPARHGPVFLTRMGLTSGVSRIENEPEVCDRLARAGFDIVSPETLPIAEQVRLFETSPIVAGMAGSAMHTAIFAPGRRKYELHVEPFRLSNQVLLDKANGGDTITLYPKDGIRRVEMSPGFQATYRLIDPRRTAEDLLRTIDAGFLMRRSSPPPPPPRWPE